eukprot:m.571456 g.571456  ORF g.571456 m.571456 type:complete len:115 (-) comp22267_c0_seq1:411-755(-)
MPRTLSVHLCDGQHAGGRCLNQEGSTGAITYAKQHGRKHTHTNSQVEHTNNHPPNNKRTTYLNTYTYTSYCMRCMFSIFLHSVAYANTRGQPHKHMYTHPCMDGQYTIVCGYLC